VTANVTALTDAPDAGPGKTAPPPHSLLVEHVTARYRKMPGPALRDVSLRAQPGELVVLLGANGSGKSTLLRVAAGLLRPDQGDVFVAGHRVAALDRRELARLVAFVPQNEAVAIGFRVREVVAMGRAPHQDRWMREGPPDRAATDDAIVRCDLEALVGRRVETLSAGEQRRVALARALAQRPSVLLLDEPAAFLDVRHRLELQDLLLDITARNRVTCVVAMHELDAAAHLASQAILLRNGVTVASGAPSDVMTPERLRQAFDAHIDVSVHEPTGRKYFVIGR
jgi:ABC-type cobalamin/Fe3+-siderophores transport system ATPase subunit